MKRFLCFETVMRKICWQDHNYKFCYFLVRENDVMNVTLIYFHQVRQGLKTYSNWPTYPQVYVKGELIGGLDIITVGVCRG